MKTSPARAIAVLVPAFALALGACESAQDDRAPFPDPIDGPPKQPGPQPELGPLVQAKEPPPPISGGTMAMAKDGNVLVAADPDRDRVHVVDLAARSVLRSVELPRHSEPGRVAVDDGGRAHVALRGSNQIATIDLATGDVSLRPACAAPRGIVYDATKGEVLVGCASGELVSLPAAGGDASKRLRLGHDVRDVLVSPTGRVRFTRFRTAELAALVDDEAVSLPGLDGANLAWRAIALPAEPAAPGSIDGEQTAIVSQEPSQGQVSTSPGAYGGASSALGPDCGPSLGIVTTRVEIIGERVVHVPMAVLPVDLATNGRELAIVAAGNAFTPSLPQIFVLYTGQFLEDDFGCTPTVKGNVPGQAIAAVFDAHDELVVQTREPAAVHIMTEDRKRPYKTIRLPGESVADTGHAVFHTNAGGFIACASCHAEGGDDAHTWQFLEEGPRRTPSLRGTLKGTEPFHWGGDMPDLRHLVDNVFTGRMSGPKVDDDELGALGGWLFALPPPPALSGPSAASARGQTLFNQRCSSCHAGAMLTNNQSVDVGTGGTMQVPSLRGVAWRAPYIHTGCAQTLFQRFLPGCGGAAHGDVADLRSDQIADLVSFLETL